MKAPIGSVFEGAIFIALVAGKERSCHCPCISMGHKESCQERIPIASEFHLALIERPVYLLQHIGFPRACYRDQIPICTSCATTLRALRNGVG